jgi:signal-transduction protein with cAMP-binding, CBS, and nucleotidyltransferase domain
MSTKLVFAIFLPEDTIVVRRDPADRMFLILEGKLSVLSPNGKRVEDTLTPGNYFGEQCLEEAIRWPNTVIAETFASIYILRRHAFDQVMSEYKHVKEVITSFKKQAETVLKDSITRKIRHFSNVDAITPLGGSISMNASEDL